MHGWRQCRLSVLDETWEAGSTGAHSRSLHWQLEAHRPSQITLLNMLLLPCTTMMESKRKAKPHHSFAGYIREVKINYIAPSLAFSAKEDLSISSLADSESVTTCASTSSGRMAPSINVSRAGNSVDVT